MSSAARLLFVLGGCATMIALLVTPPVARAEPTWWERCEELPDEQIEECFYEHNGQEPPPEERPPTRPAAPIRSQIEREFQGAHSLFINCPGNNRVGDNGLGCEFRFIRHRSVVKGLAEVEAENESWSHTAWWLMAFHAQAPAPRHWRSCDIRQRRWEAAYPVRLSIRGTACQEASELAHRISNLDISPTTLRLPHRFNEGEFKTNTLGFVVSRYQCRGRVRVLPGNPNPYGRETATCKTRFGDRITYVFDLSN